MQISLIEFSVKNFKIFKEEAVFSMVSRKNENSFEQNGEYLLNTSVVYGPNASGKSTLLESLMTLLGGVAGSATTEEGKKNLPYNFFALDSKSEKEPVSWSLTFCLDEKIFKYSVSIYEDYICTEKLVEITASGGEKVYLNRDKQNIILDFDFSVSEDVIQKTREDVLFLSAAAQWNNKFAIQISSGFAKFAFIRGNESAEYNNYTVSLIKKNGEIKDRILNLMKKADFFIESAKFTTMKVPKEIRESKLFGENVPEEIDTVEFLHSKFDSGKKSSDYVSFKFNRESAGTQAFFNMLGPVIDTLDNGGVLFIDEIDNSLHPLLTKFIIDLFEKANPNDAQLIATTHDVSILNYKDDFYRRQFWFTDKSKNGSAKLFSLAEFNAERNESSYFKKYLEGRFGALPFVESL
jgi:AAA15 family ATPase/GTPase